MVKLKSKPCGICHKLVNVRYQEQGDWELVCLDCWQVVSQDNPSYKLGIEILAKTKPMSYLAAENQVSR